MKKIGLLLLLSVWGMMASAQVVKLSLNLDVPLEKGEFFFFQGVPEKELKDAIRENVKIPKEVKKSGKRPVALKRDSVEMKYYLVYEYPVENLYYTIYVSQPDPVVNTAEKMRKRMSIAEPVKYIKGVDERWEVPVTQKAFEALQKLYKKYEKAKKQDVLMTNSISLDADDE